MTTRAIALLVASVATLSGCAGVADSTAKHELSVRVSRDGQAVADRHLSVSMRSNGNDPFGRPHEVKTDSVGQAHLTFETRWSGLFFVIPPVGLIPSRPPKPAYTVTVAGKQVVLSPDTPGVTYRWEDGSWHTDASLTLP